MKLPKSIIKRYGITKKAWSVFRSSRSSGTSRKKEVRHMARRRVARAASRFYRRSTRNVRSGGKSFKPLLDAALGGAAVGAAISFTPSQYNTPTTRVLAGAAASYMGSGFVKDAGKILIGMETARIVSGFASGTGATIAGSASNAQTNGWV